MEGLDMASGTAGEDKALLDSLGANAVDREIFEQEFLEKLVGEYQLDDTGSILDENLGGLSPADAENLEGEVLTTGDHSILSGIKGVNNIQNGYGNQKIDGNEGAEDPNLNIHLSSKSETPSKKEHVANNSSSKILQSLLQRKETEDEKKVRLGEMTPFGAIVGTSSERKGTFSNLDTYLEAQTALDAQFQKNLKSSRKKRKKADSSSTDDDHELVTHSPSSKSLVRRNRKSKSSREPLNMNILFPKTRKPKAVMGSKSSENPAYYRRRPGALMSEKNSTYINPNDDSDYIPSDSEHSGVDDEVARPKKTKKARGSHKKIHSYHESGSDSSEYLSDDDYERPSKKRKKETDDGDVKYYQSRVQQWKESETRFTNEVHTMEGGFKLPMHIWNNLYKYQKVGVKWLWELHQQRSGGILGDEMGLGKTIQIICFLAGLSCSNMIFRFSEFRGMGPSLIICPATVMQQWVQEFHKWWPPFRVAILHESGSYSGTKHGLVRSVHESHGLLITTYTSLVKNQDEILKYNWHYVILDEGHKIRNPDALITLAIKQVKTPHRIILSGSPLQNNLKELWSLFDFIFPGKLGTLPTFMEQFSVPITQGGYANATDMQVAAAFKCATTLRDLISPYLLRRMKSDVNKHLNLPSKNEQVLFCKLTDDQKALYKDYLKTDQIHRIIEGRYNLFVGLIHLRKICNHPHLFDGGPKKIRAPVKKNRQAEKDSRFQGRIPKKRVHGGDRHSSDDEEGSDIDIDPSDTFGHWSKSGKMVVVRTLLKLWKQQDHKVLLFTQSRQMLCILENFVKQEKYSYLRLDGSTAIGSRQSLIKKFNEDPSIFVFILTTRVGGLGVNLTGANRVILFDPDWNPSTDLQARERAWRIGQERQVTIYRLITAGTIEEKIYHRQIFKQFLTNRVLKDPRQKRFFKSNNMMELFTYNEGSNGTETEAIFAGTNSTVSIPKRQRRSRKSSAGSEEEPREKSTGKFRGVPNLVKQKAFQSETEDNELETQNGHGHKQDEYVLRKLFKKSGVEGALKHDKIMDSSEPDYLIVEKEAERVAKDAIKLLRRSREQCWAAETGRVTWTGQSGSVRQLPPTCRKKTEPKKPESKKTKEDEDLSNFFGNPKLPIAAEKMSRDVPILSAKDILAIIRNRQRPLIEVPRPEAPTPFPGDDFVVEEPPPPYEDGIIPDVRNEHVQLLRDIREFIAFRAMVDGQASTTELISEFGNKLPPKDSPLFKQMLNQLCTHRQVEGQRIWRLKLEFR